MGSRIYLESRAGRVELVPGTTLGVGRLSDNEVVLDSPRVSRRHARIDVLAEGVQIMDLQSGSGTRVNGARLPPGEWFDLRVGDRLEFADEMVVLRGEGDDPEHTDWELTIAEPSPFRE